MRILHAADLHLDSPFAALDAEKAKARRAECRRVLEKLAGIASERKADMILLSGDLFDGANVYRDTVEALETFFERVTCPIFISPGNHDYYRPRSPYTRMLFPEHVHLFASPEITAVAVGECVVYGAAFWDEQEPQSFLEGFQALGDKRLQIMCLHGDLTGGPYNPITKAQIARSGLDYLALGHIHKTGGLLREGGTFYAYPGCCEGRGFDETGEKGCLLIDVEKGAAAAEFIPLSARRYEICAADVSGGDVFAAAEAALAGQRTEDVIRLVLTGERQAEIDCAAIERAFGGRFFGFEVLDETFAAEDIWARAKEDTLRGAFLRNLRARYDAAESESERAIIEDAAKAGLAALDGREL